MAGKEVGGRKLVRGETSVIGLLQEQHEQVLSITSAASGAGICKESVAAAGACQRGSASVAAAEGGLEVRMHLCGIHRCGIYGACPVVMGAVAVVRVGITLGHLSGHHARGVRAQPRMHLSGLAESWHDLARERGGDGERGKGPSRPPRARPRPTTYLCLEPIGRPICPVACCVLRDERRGACADRGDARDHCRSRVMRCVVRCVRFSF